MLYNNSHYLINCIEIYSFSITYSFVTIIVYLFIFYRLSYLLIDVIIM